MIVVEIKRGWQVERKTFETLDDAKAFLASRGVSEERVQSAIDFEEFWIQALSLWIRLSGS